MQNYSLTLESEIKTDYHVQRAMNSVDISFEKNRHQVSIDCDFESPWNVGIIVGNSGSGKSTFAEKFFSIKDVKIDANKPVISNFKKDFSYEDRVSLLTSVGLSSVPEWIKPMKVLSNGERTRADVVVKLSYLDFIVIDEFTSVLDRNVAKIMAHSIQKYVRRQNKQVLLITPHFDILDWVNADWVIDMNEKTFHDRRSVWRDFTRKEKIRFEIAECPKSSWQMFSKYHYLSQNLPGGDILTYGLYIDGKQMGFQCFAKYVPNRNIYHSNRTVIHPEYVGLGLGIRLINITSKIVQQQYRPESIQAKYSNNAIYASMKKQKEWKFMGAKTNMNPYFTKGLNNTRNKSVRRQLVTYHFRYVG